MKLEVGKLYWYSFWDSSFHELVRLTSVSGHVHFDVLIANPDRLGGPLGVISRDVFELYAKPYKPYKQVLKGLL